MTSGPLVWLDMDQKALDDAYDQSVYAANQALVHRRRNHSSAVARQMLGEPQRFAYGEAEIEQLDLYLTSVPNAPVCVFIHGGAWRNGRAKDFGAPAEMMVDAGANFAVVDFNSVDETGGDLFPMVDQVRRAVAWVYLNASNFGSNPDEVYVIGHSSGGHLASCVITTDWQQQYGLAGPIVKGAMLSSGMYDLEPVRLSKRSAYVNFTHDMVEQLSAIRHIDRITAKLVISHGTEETPEFQRQARDFTAALDAAGKPAPLLVGEALNHFEILETLASPYGLLGRQALRMMELGPV